MASKDDDQPIQDQPDDRTAVQIQEDDQAKVAAAVERKEAKP
jgi:hypothetical protein